jgi:hypothetical protein
MEWMKGLAAFALVFGFLGYAFWRSRGTPPSGNRSDASDATDLTHHSN